MAKLIYTKADGTKVNQSTNRSTKSPKLQKNDVLIIGAGFSKAITNQAPTMDRFLKYALDNKYYLPNKDHDELKKAVTHFYGDKKGTKPNIEELATLLDSESNSLHKFINRDLAYDQLLQVIKSTLSNVVKGAKQSANFYLYKKLAEKCIEHQIPIISFNYDLLVDNLLLKTKKWNPLYGYGGNLKLSFDNYLSEINKKPFSQRFSSSNTKTILLKMHGSLNWGLRNIKYPDGSNPIEINPLGMLQEIFHHDQNKSSDFSSIRPIENSVTAKGGVVNVNYKYKPLIIPPLSRKDSLYGHPFIKHTWYTACQAISNSKRIFLVGYSLPASDFEVRNLLLEGLSAPFNDVKKNIFLINPDENVLERAKSLRSEEKVFHLYEDCIKWLKDIYDD